MKKTKKCWSVPKFFALNSRGQTALEFMMVLPFFLMMVFTVILFAILVFSGQMTTFATFMGGRAAAVWGDADQAAKTVLPGISVTASDSDEMTVTGTYILRPLLGHFEGENMTSPLFEPFTVQTSMQMHRFKGNQGGNCNAVLDDNPVGLDLCK